MAVQSAADSLQHCQLHDMMRKGPGRTSALDPRLLGSSGGLYGGQPDNEVTVRPLSIHSGVAHGVVTKR
jgi:hypothetical protein